VVVVVVLLLLLLPGQTCFALPASATLVNPPRSGHAMHRSKMQKQAGVHGKARRGAACLPSCPAQAQHLQLLLPPTSLVK
jgi:hypothetical protein